MWLLDLVFVLFSLFRSRSLDGHTHTHTNGVKSCWKYIRIHHLTFNFYSITIYFNFEYLSFLKKKIKKKKTDTRTHSEPFSSPFRWSKKTHLSWIAYDRMRIFISFYIWFHVRNEKVFNKSSSFLLLWCLPIFSFICICIWWKCIWFFFSTIYFERANKWKLSLTRFNHHSFVHLSLTRQ